MDRSSLILTVFIFCFAPQLAKAQNITILPLDEEGVLCSTGDLQEEGTCYGKANCTACKNCKYCRHCNSGGTCGVCSSRVFNLNNRKSQGHYSPPKSTVTPRETVPKTRTYSPPSQPLIPESAFSAAEIYVIKESTSLRYRATHESKVIKRFTPGDRVILLEKTNRFWWKVDAQGDVGWVKCLLLER